MKENYTLRISTLLVKQNYEYSKYSYNAHFTVCQNTLRVRCRKHSQ